MSIDIAWFSREFPTYEDAVRRVNAAVDRVWARLFQVFGERHVLAACELDVTRAQSIELVRDDWFEMLGGLTPAACQATLAKACALSVCPTLLDFEALAVEFLLEQRGDAVSVSVSAPVVDAPVRASTGAVVPLPVPRGDPYFWAFNLVSLRAARDLVRRSDGEFRLSLRPAVEFHLSHTGKLRRDEKGALRVNEGAFVT